MRSRYDLADDATQQGSDGSYYKDIFTIPTEKFNYKNSTESYNIEQTDIERQDLMIANQYGYAELDDIVLWLNNIGFIKNKDANDEIEFPDKNDLEEFYFRYRV